MGNPWRQFILGKRCLECSLHAAYQAQKSVNLVFLKNEQGDIRGQML